MVALWRTFPRRGNNFEIINKKYAAPSILKICAIVQCTFNLFEKLVPARRSVCVFWKISCPGQPGLDEELIRVVVVKNEIKESVDDKCRWSRAHLAVLPRRSNRWSSWPAAHQLSPYAPQLPRAPPIHPTLRPCFLGAGQHPWRAGAASGTRLWAAAAA